MLPPHISTSQMSLGTLVGRRNSVCIDAGRLRKHAVANCSNTYHIVGFEVLATEVSGICAEYSVESQQSVLGTCRYGEAKRETSISYNRWRTNMCLLSAYSSILNMEAVYYLETSVRFQPSALGDRIQSSILLKM
jgi:hypothetical protein